MDELHRHLFTVLMDREWKHGVAAAVDVTLLGRFYERFADHAVEMGRRVIFEVTGEHPSHDSPPHPHVADREQIPLWFFVKHGAPWRGVCFAGGRPAE